MIITLWVMMILDYASGILKGYKKKNINSNRAYVGLRKKLIILIIIVAGTILDKVVPGVGIRNIILIFYTSTEFLSITENAAAVGVPIPKKLKLALEQLQK
ncbi:MAG: phage holin family protein [Fusobacterium sp.]